MDFACRRRTRICKQLIMSAKLIFQTALYIPVILGLIILASIALRWSLADVYATQVSHHLDTVDRDSSNKNLEQWRLARQQLELALDQRPVYAGYFELAEKFYQKLGGLELRRNPIIEKLVWSDNETKALGYARSGLCLTPSWPYLWNKLAISKLLLKQFDSELAGAIERSVYLGPWERSVQYGVALAGLSYWSNLQGASRLHVSQAIEHTAAMEKIKYSYIHDIKKLLSHVNFAKACDDACKSRHF